MLAGNEVRIVVEGDNKSKPAFDDARKGAKELGEETGKVAKRVSELKAEIVALNKELDATGDTALFQQITVKEQELARFERAAKRLAAELADQAQAAGEAGAKAGSAFAIEFGEMAGAGGPILIGGLVALAAMAAPTMGAMIGGAVLGGVGMGGLIGGIAMAARDPRVKQAGEDFAHNALPNLDRMGAPFVEPVIGALDRLDDKFRHISMGPLLGAFEDLSREVAPFTLNLERAADKFIPGFTRALKAAEPVIRTIGNELPGFAADMTAMFDAMSEDPDGAVMGIKKLMDVLGDTLVLFGELVGWMEQTYEGGVAIGLVMSAVFEEWFHWLSIIAPPFELLSRWMGIVNDDLEGQADALARASTEAPQFAGGLDKVKTAAEEAADKVEHLGKVIDDIFNKNMNLDEATLAWQKRLLELPGRLREGRRTLGTGTLEGIENRGDLLEDIQTSERLRDAYYKDHPTSEGLEEANRLHRIRLDQLREEHLRLGFIKAEVDGIMEKYRNDAKVSLQFQFPGLYEGLDAAQALAKLAEIGGGASDWSSFRSRERRGMASGGISSGGLTMMHEQGWEMVELPNGARVIPHGTSQAMMAGASSPQDVNLTVQLTLDGRVLREISIDDALSRGVDPATVAGAYP